MADYSYEYVCELPVDGMLSFASGTTTIPVREGIVRCRDCESVCERYEGMGVWWCEYLQRYVGSSDFCAWGVRRADG